METKTVDAAQPVRPAQPAERGFARAVEALKGTAAGAAAAGIEPSRGSVTASMKEGIEKAMTTAEQFVSFGQSNMEAMIRAGQIWTAGLQDLSRRMAAHAQASFDDGLATFRAMSTAKSLKDALDLQTGYARSAVEKTLVESGRWTETSLKLAEEASAPLAARVTAVVDTLSPRF